METFCLSPIPITRSLFNKFKSIYWIGRTVLASLETAVGVYVFVGYEQAPLQTNGTEVIEPPTSIQLQYAYIRLFIMLAIILSTLIKLIIEINRYLFTYLWDHIDSLEHNLFRFNHAVSMRLLLFMELSLFTVYMVLLTVFMSTEGNKVGIINEHTDHRYYRILISGTFLSLGHFLFKWALLLWYLGFFSRSSIFDLSRLFFPWWIVPMEDMGPFFPQLAVTPDASTVTETKKYEQVLSYLNYLVQINQPEQLIGFDVCAICTEKTKDDKLVCLSLTCTHIFHQRCVGTWLTQKNTCPLCCRIVLLDVVSIV